MRKAILIYFVCINAFAFVVTAADLKVPWIDDGRPLSENGTPIGIVTQSALGGALGSYGGLLLADAFDHGANESLRRSLLILLGQNAVGYLFVVAGSRRRYPEASRRETRESRDSRESGSRTRTDYGVGRSRYGTESAEDFSKTTWRSESASVDQDAI